MDENRKIDERIKEAELKRLESEIAKNQAEEKLTLKHVNQKWYSGTSLKLVIGGFLTAVALGGAFYSLMKPVLDLDKEKSLKEYQLAKITKELAESQLDSLNLEKIRVTARLDSMKTKVIINSIWNVWGKPLHGSDYENALLLYQEIKKRNYYDAHLNPQGLGVENKFSVLSDSLIVYDEVIGLYWQRDGSQSIMTFQDAEQYIQKLNDAQYAGFSDWRLPTVLEAMTLMEPVTSRFKQHLNPFFSDKQWLIFTAEKCTFDRVWSVSYRYGNCGHNAISDSLFVRALRSEGENLKLSRGQNVANKYSMHLSKSMDNLGLNNILTDNAWEAYNKEDYKLAIIYADSCINAYEVHAFNTQKAIEGELPVGRVLDAKIHQEILSNGTLNDVSTCYFIKGKSLIELNEQKRAVEAFKKTMRFHNGRTYDPTFDGFWSPAQASKAALIDIN